jgi:chorismate mutase
MVKNPINPDLGLWIGAIERVHKSGTNKIAAIHRGFSQYSESKYRNVPQWEIPIELKRLIPQISLICDPSHIGGKRNMIEEISQKALDLNYSGLMIESHITPDEAWSDREQQVTPDTLVEIFASLTTRNSGVTDPLLEHNLEELREKIDAIDDNLLELLSTRMNVAEEIGRYKGQHNMTILQTERWNEILQRAMRKSTEKGLSKDFIQKYFNAIHQESINHQVTVMNEQKKSSKTEQNS